MYKHIKRLLKYLYNPNETQMLQKEMTDRLNYIKTEKKKNLHGKSIP